MRNIDIRLHKEYCDVLMQFGTLSYTANCILHACEIGAIDLFDKPVAPPKDGTQKCIITIDNEWYERLLDDFGPRNTHISLRRLLYWFVDNEVYNDIGLRVDTTKLTKLNTRFEREKANCIQQLKKLQTLCTNNSRSKLQQIIQILIEVER